MKPVHLLGYAGLIPFIVLPLSYSYPLWLSPAKALELYQLYSALILGFMAGVLWPALHNNTTTAAKTDRLALTAVLFPVLSFIALFSAEEYFLPAQACLFVLLRLTEMRLGINRQYQSEYRTLRNQLTLVVLFSHLLFYYLLSAGS